MTVATAQLFIVPMWFMCSRAVAVEQGPAKVLIWAWKQLSEAFGSLLITFISLQGSTCSLVLRSFWQ